MIEITTAHVVSSAPAERFFEIWADTERWPEWNLDTEWVRLDSSFAEGATGTLKPKGGPAVRFVVERLEPGRSFVDVSRLPGARLTFAHTIRPRSDGQAGVEVAVTVTMSGPAAFVWKRIMGGGFEASSGRDLKALAARAEERAQRLARS